MKQVLATVLVIGGLAALPGAQEVFSVGNGVSAPTVVREVKPDYTAQAQASRVEGTVLLNVVVLDDGTVGPVAVERSLDTMFGLDEQAVKAMRAWTFKPGTKDGKAVAVRVHVEMTFTLK